MRWTRALPWIVILACAARAVYALATGDTGNGLFLVGIAAVLVIAWLWMDRPRHAREDRAARLQATGVPVSGRVLCAEAARVPDEADEQLVTVTAEYTLQGRTVRGTSRASLPFAFADTLVPGASVELLVNPQHPEEFSVTR